MNAEIEKSCQQWMKAAQAGDKPAYRELLAHVQLRAERYLMGRISLESDRHDVMQDILVSIHKARHTYEADKPFYPWMYAIFNFRLQDYLRRYYRLKAREVGELLSPVEDESTPTPESQIADRELTENLLSCLKPKQRRIIELLYMQGSSAKEVSAELDISVSDVRTTAHRAMKQLKEKAQKVS